MGPHTSDLGDMLQQMDGVPFAVELLAKQAQGVDLDITLQRWRDERLEMLQSDASKGFDLTESIEFSLRDPRLSENARRLLSVLALLPAGLSETDRRSLFPWSTAAIALLQKAALVEREGRRWRLLVFIREQVRDTRPPQEEDKKKLLEFYFSLAQRLGPQVGKANGREAFNQLFEEIDNIESLLLMALEEKNTDVAIAAALQVSDFVRFSGRGSAQPLEKAQEVAKRQGDRVKEAWCLLALSRLHLLRRPQYNRARQLLEKALGLFQQAGDPKGEAECLRELGHTAANEYELEKVEGKLEQAEGYFRRALTMQEQFDDPIGEAYCRHGLARVALLQDKHEEARRLFRETLQMFSEQNDQLGQAYSLRHLGELEEDDSQLRKACEFFDEVGELRNLAHGLHSRSELARKRGALEEAEQLCRQALDWFQKLRASREEAWCRISLAQVVHVRSRPAEAHALLEQALQSARQLRDEKCEEKCLRLLREWGEPPA
jgi:tetratricopeptide (TPR) repeat protein